ncbi:mitochondrial ribosomal small subunit component [Coemansia sp. RSA 2131]|nr:mitochondrial ribosomal small subunit component [Coemansia sp. RSA 2131]
MYKKPSAPRGIKQAYEQLLSIKMRGVVPPWLHAMRSVPPADSLVREPSMFATHGKTKFEIDNPQSSQPITSGKGFLKRTLPKGCVSLHHKKIYMRVKCNRPPRIVFPEDKLRKEFYKNHPFEASRPRTMIETGRHSTQKWDTLSDGTSQVTGESVIRYQHYLMQTKGLSKQDAYTQATDEFYAIRAQEDMEAKVAQEEAHQYGARPLKKPYSAYQLFKEDKMIRSSAEAFRARRAVDRMRDGLSEKTYTSAE